MFSHRIYANKNINEWVIAFYGYGQSAEVYAPFHDLIKESKNLLVIDLPSFDYKQDIEPEALKVYIGELLEQNNIAKFQSVSFSIGGRMNLFMPQFFPAQLSKMILIAPDIGVNFWNRIAARTTLGNRLFRFFVKSENAYLNIVGLLRKIGLLNKSVYTFTKWNMRDKIQRTKVYNTWMNMRQLVPNIQKIATIIEKENIELVTYFGKRDKLIRKPIYNQCIKAFPNAQHNLLDKDHNLLKPDFFTLLAQELV